MVILNMLSLKRTVNFKNLISTFILLVLLVSLFPPVGLAAEPQRITSNSFEQGDPVVSDKAIAWQDHRNDLSGELNNIDIYSYPLPSGPESKITPPASQESPAIYDDKIVYHAFATKHHVYLYNLSTKTTTQITPNTSVQVYPDIYENKVVYQDSRNFNSDIYLYDLSVDSDSDVRIANYSNIG